MTGSFSLAFGYYDFILPGEIVATNGLDYVVTEIDLTQYLNRGDTFMLGPYGDLFTVEEAGVFDASRLPLGQSDNSTSPAQWLSASGIYTGRTNPRTRDLNINATADEVKSALEQLSTVGTVNVAQGVEL